MPVYGTPEQDTVASPDLPIGPELCPEVANVVTPNQPCEEGCPILIKQRAVLLDKGVSAVIDWPLRMRDGKAANLENCDDPSSVSVSTSASLWEAVAEGTIVVRFSDCDFGGAIYEIEGTVQDTTDGTVRFTPPDEVIEQAGIYQMSIGVRDEYDRIIFHEPGLLSVEPSLFGDYTQTTGPPTVRDLRMHLRDTAIENDLLGDVEFDVSEIVYAVTQPIRQWNETPPPVARHNCRSFPYAFHWRQAIVGELLRTAAHHYMRNEFTASHGGISGNFKNKHQQYLQLAEVYSTEWRRFIKAKKVELNAAGAYGSLDSLYGAW